MNRNLLLAVTLSIAVYAAWFGFIEKKVNPQPAELTASPSSSGGVPAGVSDRSSTVNGSDPSSPGGLVIASSVKLDAARAETVIIGDAIAKIHPKGAAIVSFLYPAPLTASNSCTTSTWACSRRSRT